MCCAAFLYEHVRSSCVVILPSWEYEKEGHGEEDWLVRQPSCSASLTLVATSSYTDFLLPAGLITGIKDVSRSILFSALASVAYWLPAGCFWLPGHARGDKQCMCMRQ